MQQSGLITTRFRFRNPLALRPASLKLSQLGWAKETALSWTSSSTPPLAGPAGGQPATLEASAAFRVKTAALSRPAAPLKADPSVVLVTHPNGDVVVYPPSRKLVILAERRQRKPQR